jgi:tetratricopeptide (TPR) repeat protein
MARVISQVRLLPRGSRLYFLAILTAASGALLAGCATATAVRTAQIAEQQQDYDRAVVEYTKVLRADPANKEARLSLDRAKLRAALDHFNRGRRLSSAGKLEESLVELQLAAELNPGSSEIDDALTAVRAQLRNKVAVAREGKTQLETLIERSRDLTPIGLDLPPDSRLPASLTFRDASREHQRGIRSAVPRPASHHRPAKQLARSRLAVHLGDHA